MCQEDCQVLIEGGPPALRSYIPFLLRPGRGAAYCDQFVCLCVSVCLSASISLEPLDRSSRFFVQIPCSRGSVLLWQRCDTLCTSGFMDDATFSRNGSYGNDWKAEPLTYYTTIAALRYRHSLMFMNALFASVALILIYEFDLDILRRYRRIKNNVSRSRFSKVRARTGQTRPNTLPATFTGGTRRRRRIYFPQRGNSCKILCLLRRPSRL